MTEPTQIPPGGGVVAGRYPPCDLDAEGNVLGQCLLVPSDIDLVIGWGLQPGHFYADANRRIFDSILSVHGDPQMEVDVIAVASDLRNKNRLDQIGGTPYLALLANTYPYNVEKQLQHHCRLIMDHWRARQAISIQQVSVATLYQPMGGQQLQETLESIEQQLWEVTHDQKQTSYVNAGVLAHDALTTMAALLASGQTITGLTTGYADLDAVVTGYHAGDLMVLAARPGMGKTSMVCATILRATRPPTDGSLPAAAYLHSLEMPKEQIALRLVCSYASVEFQKIRLNKLQQHEWLKLFDACKALMAHPILIDDKPAITVAELRSNVRKIKREIELKRIVAKGLVLVAVDYLQLMRGEQGQGREREVASLTAGLKNTAKTEKVCMLALSQLNRGVESRGGKGTDKQKRPALHDLRECLAADQWVYDSETGARVQIKDLTPGPVASLGTDWKIQRSASAKIWSTGVKPVVKLITDTGRTLRATGNHPVRTLMGWKRIDELKVGERIAVPRSVPEPKAPGQAFSDDELAFLGYMISDGTYLKHRSVGYVKADPVLVNEVRRIALGRFGITAKDHRCVGHSEQIELTTTGQGRRHNPIIAWLKQLGIHGQLGSAKEIPEAVLRMDNRSLGIFLAALWAGDGSVIKRKRSGWALKFTSTSFVLLDQVMWILTRLGVIAVHGPAEWNSKSKVPLASITICDNEFIRMFAKRVPMIGAKGKKLALAAKKNTRPKPGMDRFPLELNEQILAAKEAQVHLARVAETLHSEPLEQLATSDVLWDPVASVSPDGESEVFDVSVPGLANFIAQNIVVHNSGAIEQDADTVMFLFRPKYYDKQIADDTLEVIVEKNRNGPTCTVELAFEGATMTVKSLAKGYEDLSDGLAEDAGPGFYSEPDETPRQEEWYHK